MEQEYLSAPAQSLLSAPDDRVPLHLVRPRDWQVITGMEAAAAPDGPLRIAKRAESRRYQACGDLIDAMGQMLGQQGAQMDALAGIVVQARRSLEELQPLLKGNPQALALLDAVHAQLSRVKFSPEAGSPAEDVESIPVPEQVHEEVASFDAG